MAEGLLKFNLPEEETEFYAACKGSDYKIALDDVWDSLRSTIKYGTSIVNQGQQATAEEIDIVEAVRDEISQILFAHGIRWKA